MSNKNTNYCKGGGKVFVGSYLSKSIKTQLLTLAAREPCRSIIMGGLRILGYRDEPWARVVMYRETLKLISQLDHSALSACEISGERWADKFQWKSYTNLFYPDFDICSSATLERYDIILAEQIFEHLTYPYRAARNVYNMLHTEGYFFLTTPFLIRVHGYPIDCTRWTETGLKFFLNECGFSEDRIVTGSWGNTSCAKGNFWYWKRYHPLLHSLHNSSDHPVMVWALAQKES